MDNDPGQTRLTPSSEHATLGTPPAFAPGANSSNPDQLSQVGPYRILRVLGEGGMGIVYLAEQTVPLRRLVALKVIKLGMDTRDVVTRFETERQALAMMDHPHIASVYDAGATADGRPYFAMEYVAGVPITEYCDAHQLPTRTRLKLFIEVCDAIQHAHQKGVIHRDIKPSNVLVVETDGKPAPKVIDFGIAKATDQRLTERTLFTQHGLLIGTPEYMSPEQADLGAVDLDTRTDIYALGVVLYELLVGGLPFSSTRLREAAFAELLRIIQQEEPLRPSARLTSLGLLATEVAARRQTKLPTLTQELRGDLDWITLKALEKDRNRRYGSASEFAADVQRYLAQEPVVARPPTLSYRVGKFVRRNRVGVAAATTVAAALIAGLIVSSVLYVAAEDARRDAADRATAEAAARASAENANTAERNARAAEELQRRAAETARTDAEAQKTVAQRALAEAERNLYFNNLDLADREWAARNIAHADELLAAAPRAWRNWEWHYTRRLLHMEDAVFVGHRDSIASLAVRSDNDRLVSVSSDGTIKHWSVSRSRELLSVRLAVEQATTFAALWLSPDGSTVAGIVERPFAMLANKLADRPQDETVDLRFWDADTGQERPRLPPARFHRAVAFSSNGRSVVTATLLSASPAAPPAGRAMPGDVRVVVGPTQAILQQWDVRTGQQVGEAMNVPGPISGLALAPTGGKLAIASGSRVTIRAWPGPDGEPVAIKNGFPVAAMSFSPDAEVFATLDAGGTVRVWQANGQLQWTTDLDSYGVQLRFNPIPVSPGVYPLVATFGDSSVRVLVAPGNTLHLLTGHTSAVKDANPARGLAIASNGAWMATGSDDETIRIWRPSAPVEPLVLDAGHQGVVEAISISHDHRYVAALRGPGGAAGAWTTWDLEAKRQILSIASDSPPGFGATFGPTADRLLVPTLRARSTTPERIAVEGVLTVVDRATGREVRPLEPIAAQASGLVPLAPVLTPGREYENARIRDVQWSADGRRATLALERSRPARLGGPPSAFSTAEVEVWDVGTGRTIAHAKLGIGLIDAVRFSPSAHHVAIAMVSPSAGMQILDVKDGRVVLRLPGAEAPLSYSPDGRWLATRTGSRRVTIWDAETGRARLVLPDHGRDVSTLAFSPDGSRLAVQLWGDDVVRLWDVATGHSAGTLRRSSGPFATREIIVAGKTSGTMRLSTALAFSADGRYLHLTTVGSSPQGPRIQIKTWDGGPR